MRTALFLLALLLSGPALAEAPTRGHAVSIYGTPALPPDFAHFPYANPDAPKGGDVALAAVGSFDSFNPFIVRGTAAAGVSVLWDTLLRAVPRTMNGLKLSKLPTAASATSPPLGAFGFA